MIKKFGLFLFLIIICLMLQVHAGILIHGQRVDLASINRTWMTTLTLEHAITKKQLRWGLMQRSTLPTNQGMTFNFQKPKTLKFWMFNCLFDMSVAFLDQDKIIREIHNLKAYPERMDPNRKIISIKDLKKYPPSDPICRFFEERAVETQFPAQYALEVNKGWFDDHHIRPGDVALWHRQATLGFIIHTLNIDNYQPTDDTLIILELPGDYPHAVWLPNTRDDLDVAFMDYEMNILQQGTLKAGAGLPISDKQVIISGVPVKYCLLAPKDWLKTHVLKGGTTVDNSYIFNVEPYPCR